MNMYWILSCHGDHLLTENENILLVHEVKRFLCLFCLSFVFKFFTLRKKRFSVWRSVIQGAFYVFKNPPMIKADKQGPGLLLELFYQLFEKCSGKFFSYNLFIAIPQKHTITSTIMAQQQTAYTKSADSW